MAREKIGEFQVCDLLKTAAQFQQQHGVDVFGA